MLDSTIIELAEHRSVSYHAPSFFLEVLPRKDRIGLLLPLEFNEVEDPLGIAEDASQWKFLVNAVYDGGVYARLYSEIDVERALPIIRLAREMSKE
jgi:predicted transport protein